MKKQLFKTLMIWAVLFVLPLSLFAYDQYESMNVGETKTFSFPSEVTNRAITMYAYNCSSDHINNVEVISYTNTSVTVKAVAYTQSQVNIRFDYWWYENGDGRNDTHMVHIDLNGSGGGGGNTGSDYNPSNYDIDYGSWGTITIDEGTTTTVYCQYDIPNPSKVQSILWSDYNQFSYEITSQSSSSCTIKGRIASSGGKLWCLMKYGSTSYKAYYTVVVKESTTPTLSLSANPAGGVIDVGTNVYLTASNSSADIYYTLNGSQPTTSSSRYTSTGITINETCTLKAFARKSGYNDSPVMTWIFTAQSSGININATNFPDENFRTYLLSQNYGKDGLLTDAEVKGMKNLDVSGMNIESLKGIEFLTALTSLSCDGNQLTSLDMSKNTALTSLSCYNNQLTSLDVSKNTGLTTLWCYSNLLTSLDVSNNSALIDLWCYSNQLTSLDVSKNTALKQLLCRYNQLTSLDVSKNTALTYLYCNGNQLTTLDVSKNTVLTNLTCWQNQIKGNAMTALINSLPSNDSNKAINFGVIHYNDEGNVCTKSQVAAAKAKGWTPNYFNGSKWLEYEGSDDVLPENVTIPSTITVVVGQTVTLSPTITPDYAVTTLTWTSDDESIATVSSEGVVTGVKKGQTFINVETDNGNSASCKLTVTAPEKIKTPTISCVGGKLKFSCETEGVTFHYKITAAATSQEATGDEVELKPVYQVTVYATKADWIDSDEVVANINPLGLKGDVNDDGEVDIADAVKIVNLVVGKIDALARPANEKIDEKEPQ